MWIRTIRINLIFRVFLTLYRPQFTRQYIMNPSKRRSRRSIDKSDEEQKSEHSSDQSHCYSSIIFPKIKNEANEGEYVTIWWCHGSQHEGTKVPDWSPKVWEVCCWSSFFSDSDETEEESEEDDNDIDYDQVPITRKFKVITWENNSSNMFYILNELAFNGDSSPDEVGQRIWDWESKYNDYYQQYLTEKIDIHIEKMRDKIVWGTTLELLAFSDMVRLNIMLYNSLDSEEWYSSINNSSNKSSISILVTNYNQYLGLKPKDSEEFILNPRLMKEAKLRKRKFSITEKQEVLSIEQKVSKLMAEKSMSKFPQYLAANDLKDVYFQEVFDFLGSIEEKKYPSRLEDTLDKKKANWKTTRRNRRNEFIKKLKYENFKRFKLRENPENRIPQLLMLHTRTESIKNESLNDEAEEDKGNNDFSDFIMKKDI